MTQGRAVREGVKLEPYNTKLETETKHMLEALVKVQALEGQRDLLNRMLGLYKKKYPGDTAKAEEYLRLLGKWRGEAKE